jgi:hypothetical protein
MLSSSSQFAAAIEHLHTINKRLFDPDYRKKRASTACAVDSGEMPSDRHHNEIRAPETRGVFLKLSEISEALRIFGEFEIGAYASPASYCYLLH